MDDLTFRRRILADPNDSSPELLDACNASVNNRKFANEVTALDAELNQAFNVNVPEGLADRILQEQSIEQPQPIKQRPHYAIAASIAFAVGLFIGQVDYAIAPANAKPTLGEIALQHVHDEAPFINGLDESVGLQQVNAKLAPFGAEFTTLPGHVYYANHCGFENAVAAHIVFETPDGKVTVFVVRKPGEEVKAFHNDTMNGVVLPSDKGSVILVGESNQDISPFTKRLNSELNWEI